MAEKNGKKREIKHVKDPRCYEENEEYYLNRRMRKAPTEGMLYYYQRVEDTIVKSEVTVDQWKKLYNFNRKCLRKSHDHYDETYYAHFPVFIDEDDGEEDDPLEHFSDFESRFCETDSIERIDREKLLAKMTKLGRKLYELAYEKNLRQEEIAKILRVKQYRVSRWLKELDEAIGTEALDDGERTDTDIQVDYIYNRYRKTGKLDRYEEVMFEDFLSNLQPWEEDRLRGWFYTEKELYRYGIKFLVRYKFEDYTEGNIYREVFKLKDLQVRGYFFSEMTELPTEYQWLFIYLEKEIEKRAERFPQPKEQKHEAFIKELVKISKKAGMSPKEYFENKFLPFYRERTEKKQLEFAAKELGIFITKENDIQPISEQIERIIAKLPAKERKYWNELKKK